MNLSIYLPNDIEKQVAVYLKHHRMSRSELVQQAILKFIGEKEKSQSSAEDKLRTLLSKSDASRPVRRLNSIAKQRIMQELKDDVW